jgi:hypothetical protein
MLSGETRMAPHKTLPRENKVQWCSLPLNSLGKLDFELVPTPQPNIWVRLIDLFDGFCHDEALLLCQESEAEWVAWIPDRGETILHTSQFCLMR